MSQQQNTQLTLHEQKVLKIKDSLLTKGALSRIQDVAAAGIKPETIVRFTLRALNKPQTGEKLANCGIPSLLLALMDAAACGLEPDGRKGHLVPFGKDVVFVAGYQGLIDRMRIGAGILDVWTEVVYPGDEFEWLRGDQPRVIHKPNIAHDDYDDIRKAVAVYACVRLQGGAIHSEVMPRKAVERIKSGVLKRAGDRPSPWKDAATEAEMWRKTAIRRVAKYIPHTPDLTALMLAIDDDAEMRPHEVKAVSVEVMDAAPAGRSSVGSRIVAAAGLDVPGNGNGDHSANDLDEATAAINAMLEDGFPRAAFDRLVGAAGGSSLDEIPVASRAALLAEMRETANA